MQLISGDFRTGMAGIEQVRILVEDRCYSSLRSSEDFAQITPAGRFQELPWDESATGPILAASGHLGVQGSRMERGKPIEYRIENELLTLSEGD